MTYKLFALSSLVALAIAGCAQSDNMQGMDHKKGTAEAQATYPAGMIDLKNSNCAVSGDKVGVSKLTEIYEGKVYHFCCDDCPKEFKKDPAKFAKAVAADPAKYGVDKGN